MLRYRKWVGLWAIVGVLLHAGLIVRHHASMVSAKLAHQELVTSLSVICHSDGTTTRLSPSEVPNIPEPTGNTGDCPMCSGMGMAAAVLPEPIAVPFALDATSLGVVSVGEAIATRRVAVCPPPRGPPIVV